MAVAYCIQLELAQGAADVLITTNGQLCDFVSRASSSDVVGVDTEFLREKTYWPLLCLLQIATRDEAVAIDPFAVGDLSPLRELFCDPGVTKVFHACSQDVEIILKECGIMPWPLVDTQVAAAFLGQRSQTGYGMAVEEWCGVVLPKTESMTDWSRRPLDDAQLAYSLDDVRYLPRLWDAMRDGLAKKGRLSWVEPEMRRVADVRAYRHDPAAAYLKLKHINQLTRRQLAVARELAAWREERAQTLDRPRRWVMPDDVLLEIAKRCPHTRAQLDRIRGCSEMSASEIGAVLAAVERGASCPDDELPHTDHRARPSVEQESICDLMYCVCRKVAERESVSQSMLASRDDLMAFLLDRESSQVAHGWRYEALGAHLDDLLSGRLGLTVRDGHVELL